MTIKEAYDLGLLTVGRIIKTNANNDLAEPSKFKCKISSILAPFLFYVSIPKGERLDPYSIINEPITNWSIHVNNTIATIDFLDENMNVLTLQYITDTVVKCLYKDNIIIVRFKNKPLLHIDMTIHCMKYAYNIYKEE